MNQVDKHKLSTIKAIKYSNQQCLDINDLQNALHSTFNTALYYQVDVEILDEIIDKPTSPWPLFSREEFRITIANYNNVSTPGLDKLSWSHLKIILKDNEYLDIIIHIANACIELGYWPLHFKRSTTIIILKPDKKSYDSPKSFKPIVLLNTVGKLIEKVIRERLQFAMAANNFIHSSQLSSLKFKSTIDMSIVSRSLMVDFVFIFTLYFLFYFVFVFVLFFYFQNNSGQGLSVTLSHQSQVDGVVTRLITGLGRIE